MRNPVLRSLALATLTTTLAAQHRLVRDINTTRTPFDSNPTTGRVGEGSSFADGMLRCGSSWYFVASTNGTGAELWKSDGTAGGTILVKDVEPGIAGSDPFYLTCCNGKVFFRATTATLGEELWISDGTAKGTVLVKDIRTGSASSKPSNLCCLGTKVLFTANDGSSGYELWISDGTATGTVMLKDIRSGAASSAPQYLKRSFLGTRVYFQADDGTNGTELWITDGTANGTTILKDIYTGAGSSSPVDFVDSPRNPLETLFRATDASRGAELWKTDGTAKGTVLVKDIWPGVSGGAPGLYYSTHSLLGGSVYFQADDGTHGFELWKTDGTAAGTVLVADVNPGIGDSFPSWFRVSGTTLYMRAATATTGNELFKLVGTMVSLVKDIAKGIEGADPAYLTTLASGKVVFSANDGSSGAGSEPWITDGTGSGTRLLKDVYAGTGNSSAPSFFTPIALGSRVMFFARDGSGAGREVWESDGTTTGTKLLKDVNPGSSSNSSSPSSLTNSRGTTLYFRADDGLTGFELWKSDRTGTVMVKDIQRRSEGSSPGEFVDLWTGARLLTLFSADDGSKGCELWVTDGTSAGTTMVLDIYKGLESSNPNHLVQFEGRVYFAARTASYGYELWVTDGTASGTRMVKDIQPGTGSSTPHQFIEFDGALYFNALLIGTSGRELWKTDGTAAGTVLVKDIWPGFRESRPLYPTPFGNVMLFQANDGANGAELWKTDGTTAGTVLVKNIRAGSNSSAPSSLVRFGNSVFFSAGDGINGTELWKTDGTAAGTLMVKDIQAGSGSSLPRHLTVSQGRLFFTANNGKQGTELFVSDGTATGTVMLKDIYAGAPSSYPIYLVAAGDGVYFAATDAAAGSELYFSDGTTTGTRLVQDINPGNASSYPGLLTISDGTLYFRADDRTHGFELFALTTGPATVERVGHACGSRATDLHATQPVLGKICLFSGTGPAVGARLLVAGLPGAPFTVPGLVAPRCAIWANLAAAAILPLPGGVAWTLPVPVPNQPSLVGAQLVLQAAQDPLPLTLSGGVKITAGN